MRFIFTLSFALSASALACAQAAPDALTPCAVDFATTGVYRNVNFGFTLTIPKGLKGTWSSPPCVHDVSSGDCVCMNDHGRSIALAGGGAIRIEAGQNVMAWTLPTLALEGLNGFKTAEGSDEPSVVQLDRIQWKGMPAYRFVVRSGEPGEAIVREAVVATTEHGADYLVLEIEAPQKQYARYRPAFNAMVRSWRASPIR